MLFRARHLLKYTKRSQVHPGLTFRWWFEVDCPAQLGLVMGSRIRGEPPEGDAAQQTCHQGVKRSLLHGSTLASLGSWGLGASQALLQLTALSTWLQESWFTSTGRRRILSPMLVLATLSAACKEVDNLMRYLALKGLCARSKCLLL